MGRELIVDGGPLVAAIMAVVEQEAAKQGMTAEEFFKKMKKDFLNEVDDLDEVIHLSKK